MNLSERFNRYVPTEDLLIYMDLTVLSTKVDKEQRMIEVSVECPYIISKSILYRLELEIKTAYDLNYMRIIPKYSSELFSSSYINDIIKEACREGAVGKGFFEDYSVDFSQEKIVLKVPFIQGGIDLLDVGHTADVIANIIKREFGLNINVTIEQREDYKRNIELFESEKMNMLRRALEEQQKAINRDTTKAEELQNKRTEFKKSNSFSNSEMKVEIKDNLVKCGHTTFDISDKEYVVGGEFEIANIVPLRNVANGMHGICVLGTVFEITEKQIKRGSVTIINVGITDKDSSIYIKINVPTDKRNEELSYFKKGESYAIRGNIKTDEFDGELYVSYIDVYKISALKRMDNAKEKRVELHLHTMMSQMDATIDPEKIVKVAKEWVV